MNKELEAAIETLEKEKNIKRDILFEAIENALMTACKSNFGKADNIEVSVDRDSFEFSCIAHKEVVESEEDVEDKLLQIPLAEAVKYEPGAVVGDTVNVKIDSQSFGRIATQIAKNVILQKIREEERSAVYNEFVEKNKNIMTGTVQRRDERSVPTRKARHASGTSSRNTPAGMMASRYFSAYSTQRISRKYSEKSASFSAMGVAVSPGMADSPAEVTVAVAVRRRTVAVFSSMEAVHSFTVPS